MHTRDPEDIKKQLSRLQGTLLAAGVRSAAASLAEQVGVVAPPAKKTEDGAPPPFELMVQRKLLRLEGRYRALVEASPDAMLVLNADGLVVLLNKEAERQFGYAREELIGEPATAVIADGVLERLHVGPSQSLEEAVAERNGAPLEFAGHRHDGSSFPMDALLSALPLDGEALLLVSIRDISARKAAEKRLSQREGRYRGVVEAAPDAIVVMNRRGKILLVNAQAEQAFGYSRDELQSRSIASVVPRGLFERVTGDGLPGSQETLVDAGHALEFMAARRDGTAFEVEVALSLMQAAEGPLVTAVIRDISRRKQAEKQAARLTERYRDLLDGAPDPLLVVDDAGHVVLANLEAERKFGFARAELVGRPVTDILPEGLVARLGNDPVLAAEDALARQIGVGMELHAFDRAGNDFPVEVMLSRVEPADDAALTVVTLRDISVRKQVEAELIAGFGSEAEGVETAVAADVAAVHTRFYAIERRNMEDALFREQERAEVTLNAIADAVLCTDKYGRISFLNRVAEQMTGWKAAEAKGRAAGDVLRMLDTATREAIADPMKVATADAAPRGDCLLLRRDGFEIPIEDSVAPIHDRDGNPAGSVVVFRDVRAARTMALEMAHSARHDFLTGLPNRLLFSDRVNQAIAVAPRHGKKVALLFLDLDGFKHVNDSLGHPIGDKLLQSIAKRLVACVRAADTVSRLGGDEFVILLSEVDRAEDAAQLASRILQSVAEAHSVDAHDLHVTASIGVSVYPDDGGDAETLVRNADMAMYQAKESGRHCFRFFTAEMNEKAAERLAIEARLRRALERLEFSLHYQPKVNLRTGEISGAEALIRWSQAVGDPGSPADFIPVAESTGLIQPMGRWVLREACRQTRAWLDAGLNIPRIAINISAFQFRSESFLESVFSALDEAHLPASYLELELTESALMRQGESVGTVLEALRDRGVKLAVDDFGTGYSSLSNLTKFPIDTLKIDKSFIRMIGVDGGNSAVVAAALNMAHSLKLRCVAEGVETAEELAFLQAHHCDLAQGYYFSRPLPAKQFARLLQTGVVESIAERRQGVV